MPHVIVKLWPGKSEHQKRLERAAEGYRAMDQRRAIKTLLRPQAPLHKGVAR